MRARADLPCHHPKWPRRCPECNKRAAGFNVVIPIGKGWNPEAREMQARAWATSGMACLRCNKAIVPSIKKDAPVTEQYVRILVMFDIPGLLQVSFLSPSLFSSTCCLPAEEVEKEKISQKEIT